MSTAIQLDNEERLLWTVLGKFEVLALKQYDENIPSLITPEKRALVKLLLSEAPSDITAESTELVNAVEDVVACAKVSGGIKTLIVQGLILELVGQAIYKIVTDSGNVSLATHELAVAGLSASQSILEKVPDLLKETINDNDELFDAFVVSSREIIVKLNGLGEGVDQHFGKRFTVNFTDIMGEFAAELISTCTDLGMDRRKVIGYLTSALMGFK